MTSETITAAENLSSFGVGLVQWAPEWELLFNFVEQIVGHIAWPIVVLIVASRFKEPILRALAKLRSLKWKDAEMTFVDEVSEIEKKSTELEPVSDDISALNEQVFMGIMKGANHDPNGAILSAFREVEAALKNWWSELETERYPDRQYTRKPVPSFVMARDLGSSEREMFNSLRKLRNRVAHDGRTKISTTAALSYVLLADRLVDALNALGREQ